MSEPTQPHWARITVGVAVVAALVVPVFLTWIATLDHERRYPGQGENWWGFYTLPAGLFYGPAIAAGLVMWTRRLWEAERPPLGQPAVWYLLLPVLLWLALFVLWKFIYLLGTNVTIGWGYARLFGGWVGLCVGVGVASR